ncbi:hypothetical protein [Streptomyces sp. NPDC014733]|uniref:hypothetical protein n=1 Tax=Streptomyces sp. NPDC014733 TaxID=3364885 RepID=UPI0036F64BB5
MGRAKNQALSAWMDEHSVTALELAERVNEALMTLTGRRGRLDERRIFSWLSGETRWPQERQRRALEKVTGHGARVLGFIPRSAAQEDDVHRREFLAAAGAAALPARGQVGTGDVAQLRARIDALAQHDDAHGGSRQLEETALLRTEQAHDLLQRTVVSSRVRGELYALASDASTTAAWAAIDTHAPGRAADHLHRALALAGMSHDAAAELRVWHNLSMLASQEGRHADALAAARAARDSRAARRDPFLASLVHARTAACHARATSRNGVLRSLGYAEQALSRADDRARPRWTHFHGAAELHGLAAVCHLRLGQYDHAEYRAHHALAQLPPELVRNRCYYTLQLALAQVQQGDIHGACASADRALALAGPSGPSARIRALLADVRAHLSAAAPAEPGARDWLERTTPTPEGDHRV